MREQRARIEQIVLTALPANKQGQACIYALKQWPRVLTFLENGRIEIDQNLCENGMRPIALGRKNWLHLGSEDAGYNIAPSFPPSPPANASD